MPAFLAHAIDAHQLASWLAGITLLALAIVVLHLELREAGP